MNDFGVIIKMIEDEYPEADWIIRLDRRFGFYFANIIFTRELTNVYDGRVTMRVPRTFPATGKNPGAALFAAYHRVLEQRGPNGRGSSPEVVRP